ncbi:uncharacterized protein LOC122376871 [Amphibalanus amphitrite]|uniref:uncharacterized protein LOC122376871 n=1 Tax=Amphibalanus amphitrite TaxID=1232801 RepID=UPI001C91C83D|nr:uncharacterized protein LOC122376871 [Amphibalanus amphitrite]
MARHSLLLLWLSVMAALGLVASKEEPPPEVVMPGFRVYGRCGPDWPFCPFPSQECRNGGWWCPHGYTCSACDYPEEANCCYANCKTFSARLGQPCRRGHNCYPCGSSTYPLCCKPRAVSLGECQAKCRSPFKACFLHGCPYGHLGWCCRWKICWGPWCAPCIGKHCLARGPQLSAKAKGLAQQTVMDGKKFQESK